MGTGSLDTILPDSGWPTLATNLKKDFVSPLQPKKESLAELCTVYYKSGQKAQTALKDAGKLTTHVPEVVAFLEKFMEANGQWHYTRDQDWFKKDGHVIGIEVNYYTNRAGAGALPGFHKDTGGDNVFVNLVFDNDDTIEATEWLPDVTEPSKARMAWQKGLLPASYQTDLNRARRTLGNAQDPTQNGAR